MLIYGGTAYAYTVDTDFSEVGFSQDKWEYVISEFYRKYEGIDRQHRSWIKEATTTGRVVMPTGRFYPFERYRDKRGELKWPRTKILNYPVQGFGADLMTLVRVSLRNKLRKSNLIEGLHYVFLSTVHDSVDIDVDTQYIHQVAELFYDTFRDVPKNFKNIFGQEFNVPLNVELKMGQTLGTLVDYNPNV